MTAQTTTISPTAGTGCCTTECAPDCCETNEIVFRPAADITESDQAFTVRLDIPGTSSEGIDIRVEGNQLSINAKVAPRSPSNPPGSTSSPTPLHREYGVGNYARTFRVGEGIDAAEIGAKYQHGVLTLTLPKADLARARKIDVRTN